MAASPQAIDTTNLQGADDLKLKKIKTATNTCYDRQLTTNNRNILTQQCSLPSRFTMLYILNKKNKNIT